MARVRLHSLRTRIIAWSFVPTTIILFAVALVTFYSYQRVAEDLIIGRNQELARRSAGQLASDMSEYTGILEALGRTADIRGDNVEAKQAALQQAVNRLVVFDGGVLILNTAGRVVAGQPVRPEVLGQDWSDRAYFRQLIRSTSPVFSDIVRDGPDGAEVVVVAVPLTGDQGEFRGTIVGMFRLGARAVSAFYGSIVKLRVGESAGAFLVDSSGRVIHHSNSDLTGEDLSGLPFVQEVLAGKVGAVRTRDLDGRDIVASYAPVPGTPWSLVAEESWSALTSSTEAYRRFLLLLLALGVVVPVAVVAIGVRRITHPIEELIQAAEEVAGGNFGRTITARTGDEIEDLAEQFNRMSAQLQESYAHLEQRVASRTRELATLNAIAAVASQSLDLDEVLSGALEKTMEAMGMEAGTAYRLDSATGPATHIAHRGLPEGFLSSVSKASVWLDFPGGTMAESKPVVRQVADYPPSETRDRLEAAGIRVLVRVPLVAKGRLVGVINLGDRDPREVTPEETALLAAIGNQIGVAVENAGLYEKAEESAAAAERNRLARDLHDAVSQTLFSASLIADVLPRIWERNADEGRRRLEELRQLTRGALAEMRTLLLELRPSALVEASLGDLMRHLAEATTGRSRLPVSLAVTGQCPLPPDVKVALYRIAQEALNNVAKHSGASRAAVSVRSGPGEVELRVKDDGRGFDRSKVPPERLGLGIMRERAETIGAALEIESQPGLGTEVVVIWRAEANGRENGKQNGGSNGRENGR